MLSTESLEFFSTGSECTRLEKTQLITKYEPTKKYLNVCTLNKESNYNCSICSKCMRTQLTLDIIGQLDEYNRLFNKEAYLKQRSKYIAKILIDRKLDKKSYAFTEEIYQNMKYYKYNIPYISYFYAMG